MTKDRYMALADVQNLWTESIKPYIGQTYATKQEAGADDVLEYENREAFPNTGESGKIYVNKANNTIYRWSGSTYVQIKGDLVIGTTTGTAADGGTVNTHITDTNIHVTATDKTTWNGKQDALTFNSTPSSSNKVATMADVPAAQVQSDWNATSGMGVILNKPSSLPANGGNAATVNNHLVNSDVPANAVFTDTTYSTMGASGNTHASGLVPDTPTTAGTTKFLREDGTWQTVANLTNSAVTSGSLELTPNTFYSLGALTGALTVTFGTTIAGIPNTYMMEFDINDSASTPTKVPSFPASVVWKEEPTWTNGKHYEVSIRYSANTQAYYGIIADFDTAS